MPAHTQDSGIFVATETFMCSLDGEQITVRSGETRVRAGHALLAAYRGAFQPVDTGVHYDTVEQATAAPGERRMNAATKLPTKG